MRLGLIYFCVSFALRIFLLRPSAEYEDGNVPRRTLKRRLMKTRQICGGLELFFKFFSNLDRRSHIAQSSKGEPFLRLVVCS